MYDTFVLTIKNFKAKRKQRMVIGIIEDDRLLSQSLEIMLQKEGYQTLRMHTRQEAKERLKGTEVLLIIDIGLPDGNGIELYQDLIKREFQETIPASKGALLYDTYEIDKCTIFCYNNVQRKEELQCQ